MLNKSSCSETEFALDFRQNVEVVLIASFKCLATDHPNCFEGKRSAGLIRHVHSNQGD